MPSTQGVRIRLGGKERTLRYTMRALDRLENETGMAPPQVVTRVNIGSVRYLVWTIWAGLIHEAPDLERDTVLDWLDALTDEEAKAIEAAIARAFGEQAPEGEEGKAEAVTQPAA